MSALKIRISWHKAWHHTTMISGLQEMFKLSNELLLTRAVAREIAASSLNLLQLRSSSFNVHFVLFRYSNKVHQPVLNVPGRLDDPSKASRWISLFTSKKGLVGTCTSPVGGKVMCHPVLRLFITAGDMDQRYEPTKIKGLRVVLLFKAFARELAHHHYW